MKYLILSTLLLASAAQAAQENVNEVNRRDFVNLTTDANEIMLTVHYPGGSKITQVCGLQLRTNIPFFANSHMEAFLKEVTVTDDSGKQLIATQSLAEPPVIALDAVNGMLVHYKVTTKSGESLRTVIRKAAESANLKFTQEPQIIVTAKHCLDKS